MKTLKFVLAIIAGVLVALLYAGMVILFIQKNTILAQLDDITSNTDPEKNIANSSHETAVQTQKTYVKASACDTSMCKLPNCRCSGADIPGFLPKSNTPQMIIFTMDGGINVNNLQIYKDVFDGVKNPNGCPVKTTFYVSGDNTDYTMVQERFRKGHEIADHSVTRQNPNTWWTNANRQQLEQEILTQRTTIKAKSEATTYGWRNPFLETIETTFQILYENGFLYDSSLGTGLSERWWPYTLDYLPSAPCYLSNCPKNSYPGLWELPLHVWSDGTTGKSCMTFDLCLSSLVEGDENSVYNLIMQNFKLNYNDNKQPFIMSATSLWFDEPIEGYRKSGFIKFMNEVVKFPDVFFVSAKDAIDWTRNPVGLDQRPFSC